MKPGILHNRPALFDWLVFICSFCLGFIFPSLGSFIESQEFSWWMLIVLTLYGVGAWLKHIPLSHRMLNTGKKREIWYMIFLLSGHWCIMMVLIIFAEGALLSLVGKPSLLKSNPDNGWFIAFTMITSLYITWLVYRSKKLPKSYKTKTPQWLARRELVADIFLIVSVSVLTFILWERGIIALLSHKAVESFGEVIALFMFLSICYMLLYLPLRYLYMVEDTNSRSVWKRMLLIFAFLLLRSLFEILDIT